jgi:gag-polyprotein putative aspartyl protease
MGRVELPWDPFNQADPGPCINVVVMNSRDIIERGRNVGLEYPGPHSMKALLDTGASVTVISRVFADYCRLFPTNEGTTITAIGSTHRCGEHAGAISFPETNLKPFDPIRMLSANFVNQPYYACLIGRDILRNWTLTFDGRAKRVTITD